MIEKVKEYLLVGGALVAGIFVYLFWRRGEKLAKVQAELFRKKANEEVIRAKEKSEQARMDFVSKRDKYNKLKRKFSNRARRK